MIQLSGVSFRYAEGEGGVDDANLAVRNGECVVLTGPSGGGKTTITRLLNGLAPAYYPGELAGEVLLDGRPLAEMAHYQVGRQVGSVFQDPKSQFFSSELTGEVAFACENYGFAQAEIRCRTDAAIEAFSLAALRTRSLDVLSSGEKQRVAVASVYALGPHTYVCDEPTANLDDEGAAQLADVLRQLKRQGCSLVVAEHRLAWLSGIADRFVYVRDGRILWERSAAEMERMDERERAAWGLREVTEGVERCGLRVAGGSGVREGVEDDVPASVSIERASVSAVSESAHGSASGQTPERAPASETAPTLRARGLCCKRRGAMVLADVDFAAHAGQVVALTGHNGAGKTTLALVLAGLWREGGGAVELDGAKASPRQRRRHVWYGSNDTGTQFFTNSVTEELLLNSAHTPERLEWARALLKQLGLYAYKDAHPATLSGGQKQRLSIACGVLSDRRVFIFDEPTSGLDGGNMNVIADVLRTQARAGKAVIVVTHDRELMRRCCDRAVPLGA